MVAVALTTIDNPYDPIEQFDQWYNYDMSHGYGTCSYLSRIARVSDQLTEAENQKELERAIDEILRYDMEGRYIKVHSKENPDSEFVEST